MDRNPRLHVFDEAEEGEDRFSRGRLMDGVQGWKNRRHVTNRHGTNYEDAGGESPVGAYGDRWAGDGIIASGHRQDGGEHDI